MNNKLSKDEIIELIQSKFTDYELKKSVGPLTNPYFKSPLYGVSDEEFQLERFNNQIYHQLKKEVIALVKTFVSEVN